MDVSKLIFCKRSPPGILLAVDSQTHATILFSEERQVWDYSPKDYDFLVSEPAYASGVELAYLTLDEAKQIYGDVLPDKNLLDKINRRYRGV